MHGDAISVEAVKSRDAMNEFAMLPLQVYGERDAWWPPDIQNEIDLLSGRAPIASYLDMMPFALRRKGTTQRMAGKNPRSWFARLR